jgi:hypothetical protein
MEDVMVPGSVTVSDHVVRLLERETTINPFESRPETAQFPYAYFAELI